MSGWEGYQNFTTTAKKYGGADEYLNFLENNARKEGIREGTATGALIGLVAVGLGFGAKKIYHKIKKYVKTRSQERQLAPIVRKEFLQNVEQYKKHKSIESQRTDSAAENEKTANDILLD